MARVLTVDQAAEMLQLNPQVVRQYLRQGKLPGRKIGRHWRVAEEELFGLTQGKVAPGSELARQRWLALSQEERHHRCDAEERRFLNRQWESLSVEEKQRIVGQIQGSLADMQFSSEDLIRERREEVEREEERYS